MESEWKAPWGIIGLNNLFLHCSSFDDVVMWLQGESRQSVAQEEPQLCEEGQHHLPSVLPEPQPPASHAFGEVLAARQVLDERQGQVQVPRAPAARGAEPAWSERCNRGFVSASSFLLFRWWTGTVNDQALVCNKWVWACLKWKVQQRVCSSLCLSCFLNGGMGR